MITANLPIDLTPACNEEAATAGARVPAPHEASLPDYQDFDVLLILRCKGLCIVEAPAPMQPRAIGLSKIFYSWRVVGQYLLHTSLLCIARVGYHPLRPDDD